MQSGLVSNETRLKSPHKLEIQLKKMTLACA